MDDREDHSFEIRDHRKKRPLTMNLGPQSRVSRGTRTASFAYGLRTQYWRRRRLGLTLVELLIGMTILAFISLMVGTVYLAHFRLFSNQSTNIDVANKSRIALDEMVNQIKEAASVTTSSVTGCGASISTGANTVVVKLWPQDTSTGDPYDPGDNPDSYFDLVLYCQDSGNNLHKVIVPTSQGTGSKRTSSDKILSTNVSQVTFTYCCDSSGGNITMPGGDPALITQVQLRLVIAAQNFDKRQTYTTDQTATAVLRNK